MGTFDLDANPDPATGEISAAVALADGSTGTMTLDANGQPATVVLDGVKYKIDGTTGILTIDGNAAPGEAKRAGLKLQIDRTTGEVKVTASTSAAEASVNGFYTKWNGRQIVLGVSTAGRLSGGGIIAGPGKLGMAGGGFVVPGYGPGRDTFGPVWLSPGEAVLTPEAASRYGYRNILRDNYRYSGGRMGQVLGKGGGSLAGGGIAGRDYLTSMTGSGANSVSQPVVITAPPVSVGVFVDGQEFRGMVQTEIQADQRTTARRVRAGSGASY